ncbi:MAG: hypothetical protein JWM33_3831 [Caulobacteraceae bacterium]|nr:hypothetical protein [Caulobacteraceae bacterium]
MDPISSADRVALILRQKLLARLRAGAARKTKSSDVERGDPASAIQALAGAEDVDDRALGRAFIHNLLADELGGELINEAQFQRMVDQVRDTIASDLEGSKLLSRVIAELRAAARNS